MVCQECQEDIRVPEDRIITHMQLTKFYSFLLKEEASLREPFSIEHLDELNDLDEITKYAQAHLKRLGAGASRTAYAVNDKQVLKIVQYPSAARENENELRHIKCLGSAYAPIVFDYDRESHFWILEERLQPIMGEELFDKIESLIGYKFKGWMELKDFFAGIGSGYADNRLLDELTAKSPWLKALADEIEGCNVGHHDFHDENWGVRPSTGELVFE